MVPSLLPLLNEVQRVSHFVISTLILSSDWSLGCKRSDDGLLAGL